MSASLHRWHPWFLVPLGCAGTDQLFRETERVGSQEDIVTKSAALGRTPYEILIIASMIEKEAKVAEDRAKISRVIHNRLFVTANNPEEPFPLQIDAACA